MDTPFDCKTLESESALKEWNNFVSSLNECPIIQSVEWGEFKCISNWQPIHIAVFNKDKIVGGISILKRKIPFIGKSLFYAPRGPVLDFHNEVIFSLLISKIRKVAKLHKAIVLKIDPEISESDSIAKDILQKYNFHFVKKTNPTKSHLLFRFDTKFGRFACRF